MPQKQPVLNTRGASMAVTRVCHTICGKLNRSEIHNGTVGSWEFENNLQKIKSPQDEL